ncbi:MAG: hypothetical protein AABX23_04710 [Nanoarchaeota archaeon]
MVCTASFIDKDGEVGMNYARNSENSQPMDRVHPSYISRSYSQ